MGWELCYRHIEVVVNAIPGKEGLDLDRGLESVKATGHRNLAVVDRLAAEEDNYPAVGEERSRLADEEGVLHSWALEGKETNHLEERSLVVEGIAGCRMGPAGDGLAGRLRSNLYSPS